MPKTYRIILLSVCQDPFSQAHVKSWSWNSYQILRDSSVLVSCENNQASKPTQLKQTAVSAENFQHSKGNQNPQGSFHELRILKFAMKQHL